MASADTSVRKGIPYRVQDASERHYFSKGNEMLTIKVRGRFIIVQKFNTTTLKELSSKEFEHFPKPFVIEKIMEFNNRYFVFFSVWDKKNHLEQLYYQEISFAKANFIGEPKRIIKSSTKITGFFTSAVSISGFIPMGGVTRDKFHFNTSYDNSKLLVQFRLYPDNKNDKVNYDKIGMYVFDGDIKPVWNKTIKMPYTEAQMNNLDYSVDSEGNAYILSQVYATKSPKEIVKGKVNYHMEMLKVAKGSGFVEKIKVGLDNKLIQNVWIFETADNYMTCAGFYTDYDSDDANGIFTFRQNIDGRITNKTTHAFPVELVNMYKKERIQKKNKKKGNSDFDNLQLTQLVAQDDGSVVIIGEQRYTVTTTYTSNGSTRTKTTYYYDDMLAAKINEDGNLAWMKKLPKRQKGARGIGAMSYFLAQDDNKNIHLLFLDNQKNLQLSTTEVPAYHVDGAGGFLTDYRIDINTGDTKKQNYFDVREVAGMKIYQFTPSRIEYTGKNKCIIEAYKKKKEDILLEIELIK